MGEQARQLSPHNRWGAGAPRAGAFRRLGACMTRRLVYAMIHRLEDQLLGILEALFSLLANHPVPAVRSEGWSAYLIEGWKGADGCRLEGKVLTSSKAGRVGGRSVGVDQTLSGSGQKPRVRIICRPFCGDSRCVCLHLARRFFGALLDSVLALA